MKTEEIKNLAKAWLSVTEKKKMDPVGKADADIDNDGDTDKSDEYLHNRRKAIKKTMGKDKDMDTKNADKAMMHDCASHVVHKEHGEGFCIPGMHTLEEQEDGTGVVTHYDVLFGEDNLQESVPVEDLEILVSESHMHSKKKKNEAIQGRPRKVVKLKGFGPDAAKGNMSNPAARAALMRGKKTQKEEVELDEAVTSTPRQWNVNNMREALQQMWEAAVLPQTGKDKQSAHAGTEESKDSQEKQLKRSKGEEDFVKKHNVQVVDGPAQEADSIDKANAGMKQAAGRPNDNKSGDKNIVNPVKDTSK